MSTHLDTSLLSQLDMDIADLNIFIDQLREIPPLTKHNVDDFYNNSSMLDNIEFDINYVIKDLINPTIDKIYKKGNKNISEERKNLKKYEEYLKKIKLKKIKINELIRKKDNNEGTYENSNIEIRTGGFQYNIWIILTILMIIFTIRFVMKKNKMDKIDIIGFIIIGLGILYLIMKEVINLIP
jgi:hypothetical protein